MSEPYWTDGQVTLLLGDALEVLRQLPDGSADCCVTSPPYYRQRDYGTEGQYGLEDSPAAYVERMREVFAEVRRVLTDTGTLWLNIGDSYSGSWGNQSRDEDSPGIVPATDGRFPAGSRTGTIRPGSPPAKNLMMIPERVMLALQDDGWIVRNKGVWYKPNAMPHPVTDRLSGRWEPFFLLAKAPKYWFDLDAVREPHTGPWKSPGGGNPAVATGVNSRNGHSQWERTRAERDATVRHPAGRNPGDVWTIGTQPFSEAHFAVFPVEFPLRCIKAGCKPGGTVLDPFSGAGTTGEACRRLGRRYVGIDLNPAYHDLAVKRFAQGTLEADLFGGAA